MQNTAFSLIIPVYNRPDEIEELLNSLTLQTSKSFEVIIVEDGSKIPCKDIVDRYSDSLDIQYHVIPNGGPSPARNFGATKARGEYLIILDSDCIIPPAYIEEVEKALAATGADAFGGPDKASEHFTDIQKAINYSMTSFFTTGGIRGGKKKMDKFYPRSFNMGIRRSAYEDLKGFSAMRFGEDIDFSIRLYKGGYNVKLFPEAWVFHKRRTDLRKFFRQVYNSGIARINLYKKYPESLKAVHLLPGAFTAGTAVCIIGAPFCGWALLPLGAFAAIIGTDATVRNKSLKIGIMSIGASFVQLTGYGCGFWQAFWNRIICRKGEFEAFSKTFYK